MAGTKPPYESRSAEDAAEAAAKASDELRSKARQSLDELRRQAEQRLDDPDAAAAAAAAASFAADDIAAVIHELQVHQIELETQNEELRRTHIELDAQREKYFERFDRAPVGYLVLDDTGIVRDANLTAAHLLGVERQLLVGQPLSAFVVPLDQDPFYMLVNALRKTGQGQSGELRLQRLAGGAPDPTPFWALLEARPMHAGGGTPAGVWMAFTDIDAGVRARDALAESELRYRGLVENMTDLIVGYDLDLRYTYVSPAFSRFMNADPGDFLGKTHREAGFPEELADFFDDALRRCLEFRTSIDVEFQAQGGDGPIEAEARVYPQLDGEGRPTGAFTLTRDVTERKRTAAALLDSEAMRDVAESVALVGSWSWSPATQQTTWSPEMYRLFDVGPEEFDGNFAPLVEARVHPDDRDLLLKTIAAVVETGAPIPAEYRVVHRDGSVHILHGEGRVDGGDDVSGPTMFGYYQDVTEQRRVEAEILRLNDELEAKVMDRTAQLEATNKELEAFAYSVSHDLRAPLRAIDGFSQIVMEDAADKLSEADVEHLQRVRAGAQRMATLIDELLGLSRISRKDLLVEEVDVSALATSVLDELREAQPERQVETVVAPGMRAEADTVLLRVILVNLLSNAWKFTGRHETARIEVGVTDADGERAFYVRDDGAGFDAQYATHLFGAFQRMHAAGLFEGDGIGLATVQRLVTRHGGRVWAEAEVEQGATFSFTLPGEATRK